MKTHLFSEFDIDLTLPYDEMWKVLFSLSEDLGFMTSQRADGFSIVGPFNIPDEYEGECEIVYKDGKVRKVDFVLHQQGTHKGYCLWEDGQLHDSELLPEMIQWL